jgi:hypothetical protein
MHCKDALFGITNTTIVTDASNWSENALGSCVDFDTKKPFAYKSGTCTKAASIESALFIRTGLLNDNGETRRRALHHMMLLHTRYQRQQSTSTPTAAAVWDMLNNKFGKQRMPFQRMQIYVAGVNTSYGDFVAIRGQMCTDDSCSSRQDVRIRPFNMQNRDSQWHKASYDMLTWGEDSALDYVCNTDTRAANGIDATYDVDGYGFDAALDTFERAVGVALRRLRRRAARRLGAVQGGGGARRRQRALGEGHRHADRERQRHCAAARLERQEPLGARRIHVSGAVQRRRAVAHTDEGDRRGH